MSAVGSVQFHDALAELKKRLQIPEAGHGQVDDLQVWHLEFMTRSARQFKLFPKRLHVHALLACMHICCMPEYFTHIGAPQPFVMAQAGHAISSTIG